MGRGYVLQFSEKWTEAAEFFARVAGLLGEDDDTGVGLEAREEEGWCFVRSGRVEDGEKRLRDVIQLLDEEAGKEGKKARAWWRLGKCLWDVGREYSLLSPASELCLRNLQS